MFRGRWSLFIASPAADWPGGKSCLNYNKTLYTAHTVEGKPLVLSLGDWEAVSLDPTEHVLH